MKKLNIAVLLLGAALFVGCAATSSHDGMKAGSGKCGGDKTSKCGSSKKCS